MTEVAAGDLASELVVGVPEDHDLARSMRTSLVSQLGARGLHLALNVGTSLAIVRYLGPSAYGDYVVVIAVTGIATLIADAGLHKLAVRESARRPDAVEQIAGTVVAMRVVLSVGAVVLAQLALIPLGASFTVRQATLVASGIGFAEALLGAVVVFHVSLRQHYEAMVRTAMEIVELAVLVVVIRRGGSVVGLAAAPVIGGAVGVMLAHGLGRRRFGFRLRFDRTLVRPLLREALPLAPALFVGVAVLKVDGLFVAALRPRADTGTYGAALQPIEYAFLAITVVAFPFLPVLSRWFREDRSRFAIGYQRGTELMLALVAIVPAVVLAVGGPLVAAAYAPEWSASVAPLRILSVALLPMALVAWHGAVLLSGDQQGAVLRCMIGALIVSAVGCLALVPRFGPSGAASAALAAQLVAVVWARRRTRALLDVPLDLVGVARVLLLAALAGAAIAAADVALPWALAMLVGVGAYVVGLLRMGLLDLRLGAAVAAS